MCRLGNAGTHYPGTRYSGTRYSGTHYTQGPTTPPQGPTYCHVGATHRRHTAYKPHADAVFTPHIHTSYVLFVRLFWSGLSASRVYYRCPSHAEPHRTGLRPVCINIYQPLSASRCVPAAVYQPLCSSPGLLAANMGRSPLAASSLLSSPLAPP